METLVTVSISKDITQDFKSLKVFLNKNKGLKDKHKGSRCFILLTGPSIAREDLRPLSDEITFACSRFFLHQDIGVISPKYFLQAHSGII